MKTLTVRIYDEKFNVIFSTEVEVEEGKEGSVARLLSATLDEAYGED